MTTSSLKQFTSEFSDIRILLEMKNDLSKKSNQIKRRLKTRLNRYEFLRQLVDIGATDSTIDKALKKYFNSLGFNKIECVGTKYREEDVRLMTKERLIIFETTGSKNITTTDDKIFQVYKHVPIRQKQYPNLKVSGVFVFNHDNLKPFGQRAHNPFDRRAETFAKAHGFCLTTTSDLFNAYLLIEKKIINPDVLIDQLCLPGIYKVMGEQ